MRDVLLIFCVEWRPGIMVFLLAATLYIFITSLAKTPLNPRVENMEWKLKDTALPVYVAFAVWFTMCAVQIGLDTTGELLQTFSGPTATAVGVLTVGVGSAYAWALIRSSFLLIGGRPKGLQKTRICVLAYPLYSFLLPFIAVYLCMAAEGAEFSWSAHKQITDPFINFVLSMCFTLPWSLYLLFSKKMKEFAKVIEG